MFFETDKEALRPYHWCGALLFAAEALPIPMSALALLLLSERIESQAMLSVTATAGCYIVLLWLAWLGRRRSGTDFGRPFRPGDLALGLGAALLLYPSATMVSALAAAVLQERPTAGQGTAFMLEGAGVLAAALALAVLPALAEELMVRGLLYSTVRRRRSAWCAIGVTALCFGLLHPGGTQALYALYCGVFLGTLREATGGPWAGVALHMALNLLALFFSLPVSAFVSVWLDAVPGWLYAGGGTLLAGALAACLCGRIQKRGSRGALGGKPPFAVSPAGLAFAAGAVLVRALLH